jgi:transposase
MLCDRGYKGSDFPVRRFVARARPSKHEAFFRLSVLPGEQAQVDLASFGSVVVGRAKRSLSCFLMVLSWSRALFARFYLDQTTESFLHGHVAAFETFGGVPRTLLYDNLKSAVLERKGDLALCHRPRKRRGSSWHAEASGHAVSKIKARCVASTIDCALAISIATPSVCTTYLLV